MGELQVEVEAGEVGLDAARLARIDRHFHQYVDDGRLPGWLILVSRRGRVAHLGSYGQRDREQSLPVEVDTVWRLASMTKPITSVAAMMLYEEGAFELKDPVERWMPAFAGHAGVPGRLRRQGGHPAGGRARSGCGICSPTRPG